MEMMDMKMTPEMKKKMTGEVAPSGSADGPEYPYGSTITLEDDHVDGMGMGGAKAGDEMEMVGTVKVIGTRSEDRQGGGKRKSVELQITKMGMVPARKKTDPKKALYGDGSKGGASAGGGMAGHKGM